MGACTIAESEDRPQREDPVLRARAGDLGAFEELYRCHAGRIHALCLRMTADPARAEELAQEAFVRAWRALGAFRGDGSGFGHWLRRVAVNAVLADRRSRRRREARERPLDNVAEFPRPARSAPAASGAARVDLERAIAALPSGARDVFVLHDVEGYRHDEVAGLLGIAAGTSKAQLHRARRLLREALRS